jgi:hypothetical protein
MRDVIRFFLDPWIVVGAVGFGAALLIATLLLLWLTRPPQSAGGIPTAAITVIPLPTATLTLPTTTPAIVETPGATTEITDLPPPPPGDLAVGAYVQVFGTGGDGLRLRTLPGLNNDVRLLGVEAEVFLVEDGPQQVDGFSWWYLVGPFDESRRGWAVSNYLAVVQNP